MPILPAGASRRRIRVFHYCSWADRLEDARAFVARIPGTDISPKIANPKDPELVRMARLDCDWHAENSKVFANLAHPHIEFLTAQVFGAQGVLDLAKTERPTNEEWWLVSEGQNLQKLAAVLGKLLPLLAQKGLRILLYAFDEASRFMLCFRELAPYLSVLIHDEAPLDPAARSVLSPTCICIHRSWVANLVPCAAPFNEKPEPKIIFLGSQLGLTEHRKRQIKHLSKKFGSAFIPYHDHSVSVPDRTNLNRYKVSLCPEGRKFTTPAMSATHTDRPFWSGCLGMVPVSEDSKTGGRLEPLAKDNLIIRYPHGDLDALTAACEKALALPDGERRRIYDYFNANETVGRVVADAIAEASLAS